MSLPPSGKLALLLVVVLTIAYPINTNARSRSADIRTGFGIQAMLGVNLCLPGQEGDCDGVGPGVGFNSAAYYRFSQYFGIEATVLYGKYKLGDSNIDASILGILGGPRVFIPIDAFDIYFEGAIGWGELHGALDDVSLSFRGISLILGGGFDYRPVPFFGIGINFRYLAPTYDELCAKVGGESACVDLEEDISADHGFMVGATATLFLPVN